MELKAEHIQITQLNYKIKNNFSKNACRKLYNPSFESLVSSQCILNSILGLETLYVVLLGHRGRLPSKINAKFKPFNTFNTHLSISNSHNSLIFQCRRLKFCMVADLGHSYPLLYILIHSYIFQYIPIHSFTFQYHFSS